MKLFLRELERTGNVRISAERAGVDYTSAYQRRKRHGEFAERWEASLAAFRATPSRQPLSREGERGFPSPGSPAASPSSPLKGEEFVTRPDGKVIKGSEARWSKRAEGVFLTELTVSGSVRLAGRAAGFSTTAIYKRRLKDRRFAAAWEAALETGRARLQAHLVEAANRTFDPEELPVGGERDMPAVSVSEAINIAKLGASAGSGRAGPSTGSGRGKGRWDEDEGGQFVTNEELDAARERIWDRLMRIKENIARQEIDTGCCHNCGQRLTGAPGESLYQGPMARYFLLGGG